MKRTTYFTGDLAAERTRNRELDEAAKGHFQDYEDGKCVLTQRRLGVGQYEYLRIDTADFAKGHLKARAKELKQKER